MQNSKDVICIQENERDFAVWHMRLALYLSATDEL